MAPTSAPTGTPASGDRVSLLARASGRSWPGTVRAWEETEPAAIARVSTQPAAVDALDLHQVWLSSSTAGGVTIFEGRARAVQPELLEVTGMVLLADERRRQSVRGTGGIVTLSPAGGEQRTVQPIDISRDGARLPLGEDGWQLDDPLELLVDVDGADPIAALAHTLRVDESAHAVVVAFDDLAQEDAEAIERFALSALGRRAG